MSECRVTFRENDNLLVSQFSYLWIFHSVIKLIGHNHRMSSLQWLIRSTFIHWRKNSCCGKVELNVTNWFWLLFCFWYEWAVIKQTLKKSFHSKRSFTQRAKSNTSWGSEWFGSTPAWGQFQHPQSGCESCVAQPSLALIVRHCSQDSKCTAAYWCVPGRRVEPPSRIRQGTREDPTTTTNPPTPPLHLQSWEDGSVVLSRHLQGRWPWRCWWSGGAVDSVSGAEESDEWALLSADGSPLQTGEGAPVGGGW